MFGRSNSKEIDVFQISNYLRSELEKVREELESEIELKSMLPKLDDKRQHLENTVGQDQEKIKEIERLIPELEEKKKGLQEGIKRRQEEISRIDEIKLMLQNLVKNVS